MDKNKELDKESVDSFCEYRCNFGKDLNVVMIYGDKYVTDRIVCKKNFIVTGWYSSCKKCK